MARYLPPSVMLLILIVISIISACAAPAAPSRPSVVITSPPSNSQFREGDEVAVQSVSNDADGIARVELIVDGQVARTDVPTSPQTSFSLIQAWKATGGSHTVVVRAYNKTGLPSDPATIQVSILSATAPVAAPTLAEATLPPPTGNPGAPSGGQGQMPNPTNTQVPQPNTTPTATSSSGGAPTATPTFRRVITLPPITLVIQPTPTPTIRRIFTLPPLTLIIRPTNTPAPLITRIPLPTINIGPIKP